MRREDGPAADRKYSAPLLSRHLDALARADVDFDVTSPGWPTARHALVRTCHQASLRGGEPGTTKGQPWRPALGVCIGDVQTLDPATRTALTIAHPHSGKAHRYAILRVRSIKDVDGRHKKARAHTHARPRPHTPTRADDALDANHMSPLQWDRRARGRSGTH